MPTPVVRRGGRAAVAAGEPEVAGVGEDDLGPAERRVLGEKRPIGRGGLGRAGGDRP